jgi:hypothetical protein
MASADCSACYPLVVDLHLFHAKNASVLLSFKN